MNLYLLVEGSSTESQLYPLWIKYLLPHFTQVLAPGDVDTGNSYYLLSGEGYPCLLNRILPSIEDINDVGRYAFFIVCLDADEEEVEARRQEVIASVDNAVVPLDPSVRTCVIVQNRSIETWLLGNRKVYPRNATDASFLEYARHYNVATDDPELMGVPTDRTDNHAQYHHGYLRAMFRERKITYTKTDPGHAGEETYFQQLRNRATDGDLKSLRVFLELCEYIQQITAPANP